MTSPVTGSRPLSQRLLHYTFFFMIIIVYSLLAFVVTMLVTGSLHVINRRFIHFEKIDIVTMIIAVVIILITVIYFVKNAKRIYRFIDEQVAHRT